MKQIILFLVFCFSVSACDISKIDAPSAPASIHWKKEGYTRRMNEVELVNCGYEKLYSDKPRSVEEYHILVTNMEQCMLDKGFQYSDGGWAELDPQDIFRKDKSCNYEPNNEYPGCISLRRAHN